MDAETVNALSGTVASLRAIRDAQEMALKIQLDNVVVRLECVLRTMRAGLVGVPAAPHTDRLVADGAQARADGRMPYVGGISTLHAGDGRRV